jgi:uncharacterized protein YigE (DUF2233 family)
VLGVGSTACAFTSFAQAQAPVAATAQAPQKVVGTFPVEERFSRPVAPGIELTTITRRNEKGPLQLFATRVNLRPDNADVRYRLQLATPEYSVLQFATVSRMAKKQNAVVAINGGYFAFGGAALGAMKIQNEWLRLPLKNRTAMGISQNGSVLVEPMQAGARATFGGTFATREVGDRSNAPLFSKVAIDNLNGYAPENGVGLLTTRFGTTYRLKPDEIAIEVDNGFVRARVESGAANVRKNGWTLIARGAARENIAAVAPGQAALWKVQEPAAWRNYATILGAGPRLLRNGKIETTETIEEFRPDVLARGPRSAIGIDRAGQLWFVAADGRAPEYSVGLTLPELALEMQKLGCTEAICLDGGGSTALVINGILVNRPSDGSERRVANALVVVSDEVK